MKKTITLILVGVLLGSTAAFATSKFFSDVPTNTWYTDSVNNLSEKGIIQGYPNGTFGPNNNVNRAELAVMLDRLVEYMETSNVSSKGLVEYYKTRFDFETLGENDSFLMKTPEELEFKEIAKVKITCPENFDGPCSSDLLILSQESLHSGNQEFYFAQLGGAGYTYYGPFSDNLERLVDESKTINSLNELY